MQRREEPRFNFGGVAQLMTFGCPGEERFLDKITGMTFSPCETHSEPIQRGIVHIHKLLEIQLAPRAGLII